MKDFGLAVSAWREGRGVDPKRFLHHGPLAARDLKGVESGKADLNPLLMHQLGYTVMRVGAFELQQSRDQTMAAVRGLAEHVADPILRNAFLDGARLAGESLD